MSLTNDHTLFKVQPSFHLTCNITIIVFHLETVHFTKIVKIIPQDRVNKAPISGNIDTPEGGLDALMQAMVCDKAIGWRPKARHIIVYSSDATYHIAGDGRVIHWLNNVNVTSIPIKTQKRYI